MRVQAGESAIKVMVLIVTGGLLIGILSVFVTSKAVNYARLFASTVPGRNKF
jgi:hypothetical protein